jgi:SAM-dependent methyltransferase
MELPLTGATFEIAFCQQGLQFFPDPSTALREMHRILVPGGRLVLSVWREIERSPGFAVLADALARHVDREAGALMTSGPFGLSSSEALRAGVAGASFSDITIRPVLKTLRFPSPEEFALRYASGSALASFVAGANEDARNALLVDVKAKLQKYVDDQGLAFPIESNVAIARK